jgi:hypothetical protein
MIITLGFEKNANFFAENWQKSPKIMIITSTPEFAIGLFDCLAAKPIQTMAKDWATNLGWIFNDLHRCKKYRHICYLKP